MEVLSWVLLTSNILKIMHYFYFYVNCLPCIIWIFTEWWNFLEVGTLLCVTNTSIKSIWNYTDLLQFICVKIFQISRGNEMNSVIGDTNYSVDVSTDMPVYSTVFPIIFTPSNKSFGYYIINSEGLSSFFHAYCIIQYIQTNLLKFTHSF